MDLSEADATITVEASLDLVTWPTVFVNGPDTTASSPGVNIAENGDAPDTISVTIPRDNGGHLFTRLRVRIDP